MHTYTSDIPVTSLLQILAIGLAFAYSYIAHLRHPYIQSTDSLIMGSLYPIIVLCLSLDHWTISLAKYSPMRFIDVLEQVAQVWNVQARILCQFKNIL